MLKLDALFNMLGVLMLFIVALIAQINPPAAPPQKPPGEIAASITWPAGYTDVDIWVLAPGDRGVGYSYKSGRVWSLLRDDLGVKNDPLPMNIEAAYTRGLPDGEYVVNVHCYGCAGKVPVPVSVEVRLAAGGVLFSGVVDLVADKQERTAIRFRMAGGEFVRGSANQVFKKVKGGAK